MKRTTDRQLTKDDFDQEDGNDNDEGEGVFKMASKEVISQRKIIPRKGSRKNAAPYGRKGGNRVTSSQSSFGSNAANSGGGLFAGLGAFPTTPLAPSTNTKPFGANSATTTSLTTNNSSSSSSSIDTTPLVNDMCGLNKSFIDTISKNHNDNDPTDLSPYFETYIKHKTDIFKRHKSVIDDLLSKENNNTSSQSGFANSFGGVPQSTTSTFSFQAPTTPSTTTTTLTPSGDKPPMSIFGGNTPLTSDKPSAVFNTTSTKPETSVGFNTSKPETSVGFNTSKPETSIVGSKETLVGFGSAPSSSDNKQPSFGTTTTTTSGTSFSFGASGSGGKPNAFSSTATGLTPPTVSSGDSSKPQNLFSFGNVAKPSDSTAKSSEDTSEKPTVFSFGTTAGSTKDGFSKGINFGDAKTPGQPQRQATFSFASFSTPSSATSFSFGTTSSGSDTTTTSAAPNMSTTTSTAAATGTMSNFGGASATPPKDGIAKPPLFGSGMGGTVFGNSASSTLSSQPVIEKKTTETSDNSNNNNAGEEEGGNDPQVDTNVLMEGKGEEDEISLLTSVCKLQFFNPVDKGWFDVGKGELRVKKNNSTGKGRLLIRADMSGRVLLNAALFQGMKLDSKSEKRVQFSCIPHELELGASKYVKVPNKLETFLLTVKTGSKSFIDSVNSLIL